MRNWRRLLVIAVVIGYPAVAFAQRGLQQGGRNYDPSTEGTWTGTIDDVKQVPATGRGAGGLHFVLSAGAKRFDVHVGPASFVSAQKMTFTKGETVTVTGSKITVAGEPAVIAREIKKGEAVLTLRDARGIPVWSGRGRQ